MAACFWMKSFVDGHRFYWLLNLAAYFVSTQASVGVITLNLGQLALYPGIIILTWAALTSVWSRMGWLGRSAGAFQILNARSIPLKFVILIIYEGLSRLVDVPSTSPPFKYIPVALWITVFGMCDRYLVDTKRGATSFDRIMTYVFIILGACLVVSGTPLSGLILG